MRVGIDYWSSEISYENVATKPSSFTDSTGASTCSSLIGSVL
jgi:hypothetical protein